MANGKMTWERWESLTPEQKEWEHFSYHTRLEDRLENLETSKWKRTLGQCASSFAGGAMFWVAIWIFFQEKFLKFLGGP